jgi:anti-sigma factor RsiW
MPLKMKDSSSGLCGTSLLTVHAFADNELNAEDWLAFKVHLSTCPDCSAAYSRILALRALFKDNRLQYQAPGALRIKIALALQVSSRAAPAGASGAESRGGALLSRADSIWKERKPVYQIASVLAASLILAATLILSPNGPALEDEIIVKYKRSLALSLPSNGRSGAFREEKPRLEGSLDFVPPIPDLAGSGFTYKGARFDQVAQRSTAVLIYSYESYVIDLFIWPSEAEPLGALSKQGYNIIHWTSSGFKFCAISTLTARELAKFQEIFASKLPA